MLDREAFLSVFDRAPLVSVDLVLVRGGCEVLLGLRNNRPAQGYWFVPGGRIFKNERMADALLRVGSGELGLGEALVSGSLAFCLMGCFEHFYPDCFAGECGVSTHYVVLGHRADVPAGFDLPEVDAQHAAYRWWPIEEALGAADVHRFTKDYLQGERFNRNSPLLQACF